MTQTEQGRRKPDALVGARQRLYRAAIWYARHSEDPNTDLDTSMAMCKELEHAAVEFSWAQSLPAPVHEEG